MNYKMYPVVPARGATYLRVRAIDGSTREIVGVVDQEGVRDGRRWRMFEQRWTTNPDPKNDEEAEAVAIKPVTVTHLVDEGDGVWTGILGPVPEIYG